MKPEKRKAWTIVIIYFGLLAALEAALLTTDFPDWIRFGPAVISAFVLTLAAIMIWHSRRTAIIKFVIIDGKTITSCLLCKHCTEKPNPWSASFPINRCEEKNRLVYNPMHIPGWCPHAVR